MVRLVSAEIRVYHISNFLAHTYVLINKTDVRIWPHMPTMKNSLTVSDAVTFTVDASWNNLQINKLNLTPQNICVENSNFCMRF